MSEDLDHGTRDLSRFDAMSTQELEEILRSDPEAPEGQRSDPETLLDIMEVLMRREGTDNTGITAQNAWRSFQQYYLPAVEEGMDDGPGETEKPKPPRARHRRWLIAAAAIALLVSIPLSVAALNWDKTRNVLAKWKDGTFSFVSTDATQATEPEDSGTLPYLSLQDALADTGVRTDIVPTWIPEGYILADISIAESPQKQVYTATYAKDGAMLNITVRSFLPSDPSKIEINDELVELYQSAGTDYYIFHNNKMLKAIWIKDPY